MTEDPPISDLAVDSDSFNPSSAHSSDRLQDTLECKKYHIHERSADNNILPLRANCPKSTKCSWAVNSSLKDIKSPRENKHIGSSNSILHKGGVHVLPIVHRERDICQRTPPLKQFQTLTKASLDHTCYNTERTNLRRNLKDDSMSLPNSWNKEQLAEYVLDVVLNNKTQFLHGDRIPGLSNNYKLTGVDLRELLKTISRKLDDTQLESSSKSPLTVLPKFTKKSTKPYVCRPKLKMSCKDFEESSQKFNYRRPLTKIGNIKNKYEANARVQSLRLEDISFTSSSGKSSLKMNHFGRKMGANHDSSLSALQISIKKAISVEKNLNKVSEQLKKTYEATAKLLKASRLRRSLPSYPLKSGIGGYVSKLPRLKKVNMDSKSYSLNNNTPKLLRYVSPNSLWYGKQKFDVMERRNRKMLPSKRTRVAKKNPKKLSENVEENLSKERSSRVRGGRSEDKKSSRNNHNKKNWIVLYDKSGYRDLAQIHKTLLQFNEQKSVMRLKIHQPSLI